MSVLILNCRKTLKIIRLITNGFLWTRKAGRAYEGLIDVGCICLGNQQNHRTKTCSVIDPNISSVGNYKAILYYKGVPYLDL